MNQIEIPETLKPAPYILLGHSGGKLLYVAHWGSVLLLFEPTNVAFLAYSTVHYSKHVN